MKAQKKLAALAMSLVMALAFTGCGAKKVKYDTVKVEGDSKLATKILWLKNKRDTIDVRVEFQNTSEHALSINPAAFHLSFEGQKGAYDSGDATLHLGKGETLTRVLHFAFKPEIKAKGTAEFRVDPIVVDLGKNKTRNESMKMKLPVEG